MVFVDGQKRSIEGVLKVFNSYAKWSGLRISIEKSTLFLAGVTQRKKEEIMTVFPFSNGSLPVKYLGLPLLTKRLTQTDYNVLLEKIRGKINKWTTRFLSYAGRLQLIHSVISSLTNFWMSAFRLPKSCVQEIDKLCSSFLWSGPDLNPRKAKVSWEAVCKPKREGGLGLKNLVDANKVSCLKLIWRIVSQQPSLWVSWVWQNLIKNSTFWSVRDNTSMGSWMWRKVLKYRTVAKSFHKIEVKNGATTSFWFDDWSGQGRLFDTTGSRGVIDLGISLNATVEQVLQRRRTRHHRLEIYNHIESAISTIVPQEASDIHVWKHSPDTYKAKFITKSTGEQIRQRGNIVSWYKSIWIPNATPKFCFLSWLTMQNRLTTGDRMRCWNHNANVDCVLCNLEEESRNHLFFDCPYSAATWQKLTQGLLQSRYTASWPQLQPLLQDKSIPRLKLYLLRYVFQTTIYHIWKERNSRRHGKAPMGHTILSKIIDKQVRNLLTSIREQGDKRFDEAMQVWLSTQSD